MALRTYGYINALVSDHTACHIHSDSLPQSAVPPTSTTPIAWSLSNNCNCKRHKHYHRNGNETALHCIAIAAATCCQLFVHYTFATKPKAKAKCRADGLTVSLAVKLYVQRIFAAAWTRMWTNICGNLVVRLRLGVRLWQEEEICRHFQIVCCAATCVPLEAQCGWRGNVRLICCCSKCSSNFIDFLEPKLAKLAKLAK